MIDPWAMALNALFNAPGSLEGFYSTTDGPALPIRVIRVQKDEMIPVADFGVIAATNIFQIRRSDVLEPAIGDQLLIKAGLSTPLEQAFVVSEEAMLDVEGMTWTVGVTPA